MMQSEPPPRVVLIADDSATSRKIAGKLFQSMGVHVVEASNGSECIQQCYALHSNCQREYDIILIDDEMPNMNGPEVITSLRSQGYAGLIIGVTGNTSPETLTKFKCTGANDLILKPMDSIKLQYVIRTYFS